MIPRADKDLSIIYQPINKALKS